MKENFTESSCRRYSGAWQELRKASSDSFLSPFAGASFCFSRRVFTLLPCRPGFVTLSVGQGVTEPLAPRLCDSGLESPPLFD